MILQVGLLAEAPGADGASVGPRAWERTWRTVNICGASPVTKKDNKQHDKNKRHGK